MEPLAHSERKDRNVPAQLYADHVRRVVGLAHVYASEIATYWKGESTKLVSTLRIAAEFHDLGKLDPDNQAALKAARRVRHLPVNHVDAGVAHLLSSDVEDPVAAALIYSHHHGLPDVPTEMLKVESDVFRDTENRAKGNTTKSITDQRLGDYVALHECAAGPVVERPSRTP